MEANDFITVGIAVLAVIIGIAIYIFTNDRAPVKITSTVDDNKSPSKFVATPAPKCALCDKSVYSAEKVQAVGLIWHKTCFKCGACNKTLALDKYVSHGEKPYCEPCHGRLFGPKVFGFGGNAQSNLTPTQ